MIDIDPSITKNVQKSRFTEIASTAIIILHGEEFRILMRLVTVKNDARKSLSTCYLLLSSVLTHRSMIY